MASECRIDGRVFESNNSDMLHFKLQFIAFASMVSTNVHV